MSQQRPQPRPEQENDQYTPTAAEIQAMRSCSARAQWGASIGTLVGLASVYAFEKFMLPALRRKPAPVPQRLYVMTAAFGLFYGATWNRTECLKSIEALPPSPLTKRLIGQISGREPINDGLSNDAPVRSRQAHQGDEHAHDHPAWTSGDFIREGDHDSSSYQEVPSKLSRWSQSSEGASTPNDSSRYDDTFDSATNDDHTSGLTRRNDDDRGVNSGRYPRRDRRRESQGKSRGRDFHDDDSEDRRSIHESSGSRTEWSHGGRHGDRRSADDRRGRGGDFMDDDDHREEAPLSFEERRHVNREKARAERDEARRQRQVATEHLQEETKRFADVRRDSHQEWREDA